MGKKPTGHACPGVRLEPTRKRAAQLFILNSDMYTEVFYQADFQRYRGLYLCKTVLYVLMKQAETYL